MRRWTVFLSLALLLGCERGEEPVAYGETATAVVLPVWIADSTYDAEFMKGSDTTKHLRLGKSRDWPVGQAQLYTSPNDTRPNFFRVFPSGRAVADSPPAAEAKFYDLFAAIVLDPSVSDSALTSVAALRAQSEQSFAMPATWTFDSMPAGVALVDKLNLSGLEELAFIAQRADGTYPRVWLVALNVVAPLRTHRRATR